MEWPPQGLSKERASGTDRGGRQYPVSIPRTRLTTGSAPPRPPTLHHTPATSELAQPSDLSSVNSEPLPCDGEHCYCWRGMLVAQEEGWKRHWVIPHKQAVKA